MYFPPGFPHEKQEEMIRLLKRPRGNLSFEYYSEGLFDRELGKGQILEVVTGQVVYRLERDRDLNVLFYHSTPGTGTRVATVNIEPLEGSRAVFMSVGWSPVGIHLTVGGREGGPNELLRSEGVPSKKSLRVDSRGSVNQFGDKGLTMTGEYSVFADGKSILEPTAIEAWNNTVGAVRILQSGTSTQAHRYEVICANVTIVMLVTGFETYCRRRFLELEQEGIPPDVDALLGKFLKPKEKQDGRAQTMEDEARRKAVSALQLMVAERRIDFQNYDRCKTAYNAAYGVKFGRLKGVASTLLRDVKRIIAFRHRIVHVSPEIAIFNQEDVPKEEPIFPSHEFAEKAISTFSEFIRCLHVATLSIDLE